MVSYILYLKFQIERCIISCDERGKSTGEGIVEYQRKNGAMAALRHCQERCFFLTSYVPILSLVFLIIQ